MNLLTYVRKEISFRKFNFVAGLISISLAMTVWSAAPSLLRALRKQTETLLLEREKATKREMLKLEDDYRIIMRDLGHNLMILAPDEDLVRLQREGVPLQTMPQDYASRLAVTGDIKSLNHILPVLQQKVNWPEQGGAEIILCGTPGQIPTPHRKRHLTEDGLAYLSPIVPGIPPGQLKIGSSLAEKLNLKAGQRLRLLGEEFVLAEVLPPEGSRQDVSVWCHLDWMQKALHKEGQISIILALQCICHADSLQQVSKDIKKWLPDVKIEEFSSMVKARLLASSRRRTAAARPGSLEGEGRLQGRRIEGQRGSCARGQAGRSELRQGNGVGGGGSEGGSRAESRLGAPGQAAQRLTQGGGNNGGHLVGVAETHLVLGGVDIDVNTVGLKLNIQDDRRITPLGYEPVVGVADTEVDRGRAGGAAIDDDALLLPRTAREARFADIAVDAHLVLAVVHRQHGGKGLFAQQHGGARGNVLGRADLYD